MRELLFDGKHDVSVDEVIEKMNYFIHLAKKGRDIYETDPSASLGIAKAIRSDLEKEYKNNSLKRISDAYFENDQFNYYSPAVHESVVSITGQLTKKNVFSFLYDVNDYMGHYLPQKNK